MESVAQVTAASHLSEAKHWHERYRARRSRHSALWRLTAVFGVFLAAIGAHGLVLGGLGLLQ